jgi:glycosyltransferase involved in cell wall biosynthesis
MLMKILIVSDAGKPQVNGVVRALEALARELTLMGHVVLIAGPDASRHFTFSLPCYPEIKLELFARRRLEKIMRDFSPDAIHLATEGSLGWTARGICLRQGRKFTTAYHTNFPDYLVKRSPLFLAPLITKAAFAVLRRFHAPSCAVMVATESLEEDLRARNFRNIQRFSYGVDLDLFKPYGKTISDYQNLPRPILLCVSRVAVEKNLQAFLELKTSGSIVLIGDGPDCAALRRDYPDAHFLGSLEGENLARHFAAADLFVFPSKTDTFGLVLLEACASGLRVAAYPAAGPVDIFASEKTRAFAVMDACLQKAVDCALSMPDNPENPRAFASGFSWKASAQQFLRHLLGKEIR